MQGWGYFECVCSNPLAHSGKYCEINVNDNAATFPTSRACIKLTASSAHRPELYPHLLPIITGNIQLAFRTHTLDDSLIFYANDQLNNFVQLHITGGTMLVFTYNIGADIAGVVLDIGPELSSGKLIQVQIERTSHNTTLRANGQVAVSRQMIELLVNYSQKPFSDDINELVKPTRPPFPTQPHVQVFITGVDDLSATTNISGFIGCLQGMLINEYHVDLMGESNAAPNSMVKPGCHMLCDQQPCANGGRCVEHWHSNTTTCDCENTSYKGNKCDVDMAATFSGFNSAVRVSLPQLTTPVKSVHLELAFATQLVSSHPSWQVILAAPLRDDHILLALANHGALMFEEVTGQKSKQ